MNCEYCHQSPHATGCPNAHDPPIIGKCTCCGQELSMYREYYIDKDGNKFCSRDCAVEYNEIKPVYWED